MFKIVFESSGPDTNMLRASVLRSMCEVDETLVQTSPYVTCGSYSLGTMVAVIMDKTCDTITDDDVAMALPVIQECVPFYYNGSYTPACLYSQCYTVPARCNRYGELFAIMHFVTDYGFLDPTTGRTEVKYALMAVEMLPEARKDFYMEQLDKADLDNGIVKIIGIDSEDKFLAFNQYVKLDMVYFMVAGAIILTIMCLYLRSLVITIATTLDILFSILIAYFLYFVVFDFQFFPFINIFVILIVIAIGADDVFIFYDTWKAMKVKYPDKDIEFWLAKTMDHAALSVFVTSLTTASAFLANLVSRITSIRCFGVFACMAILCNFLLMITWIPSFIVVMEWFNEKHANKFKCCKCFEKFSAIMSKIFRFIFSKALPFLVEKLWFLWILVFLGMGIWGLVATLYKPKLGLPSSVSFQTFYEDHPMERYESFLQYQFRFIRAPVIADGMELQFVWGLTPEDNGNHLDPDDYGQLVFDPSFDLSTIQAWNWMKNFCITVRSAPFTSSDAHPWPCLMELFEGYIQRPCLIVDDLRCCELQSFPDSVFSDCFDAFMNDYNAHLYDRALDAPVFDSNNTLIAYKLYNVPTVKRFTAAYADMRDYNNLLNDFLTSHLQHAPAGVANGWLTTNLRFYDLQKALSTGTYMAILLSLACAGVVMLFTSLNVLITIYAIASITLAIFFTVGILVLLDWELNILEAIVITASVGLSIDFAIHYGVAYRLSDSPYRVERMRYSLSHVGSPVAMASLTTFLAGASVLPSVLVAYYQLSIFLMLVMVNSWSFATFLFLSLCRVIGPQGKFAQIPSPFSACTTSSEVDDSSEKEIPETASISPEPSKKATTMNGHVRFSPDVSDASDVSQNIKQPKRIRKSMSKYQNEESYSSEKSKKGFENPTYIDDDDKIYWFLQSLVAWWHQAITRVSTTC